MRAPLCAHSGMHRVDAVWRAVMCTLEHRLLERVHQLVTIDHDTRRQQHKAVLPAGLCVGVCRSGIGRSGAYVGFMRFLHNLLCHREQQHPPFPPLHILPIKSERADDAGATDLEALLRGGKGDASSYLAFVHGN